jgi:DNA-binding response OmpR family regulator
VRLRALGRRVPAARPAVLQVGDLRLDPGSHRAWRGEAELELSIVELIAQAHGGGVGAQNRGDGGADV